MGKAQFSFSRPAFVGFVLVLMVLHFRDVSSTAPSSGPVCGFGELKSIKGLTSCDYCEDFCNAYASGFGSLDCSNDNFVARFLELPIVCTCCE
ncbi:hypothetical protein MKW92_030802 [Papaver armeniacum]|nr:hypothetical protein MKW92_030802 [Papaver armeniacum]